MSTGGGGGSSGKVDKPGYLKGNHEWLLNEQTSAGGGGVTAAILDAREDNPYDIDNNDQALAYDPSNDLTLILSAAANFLNLIPTEAEFATGLSAAVTLGVSEWDARL